MITEATFNGFLAFVFLAAVPLAALLGLILRRRYRRAIGRAMQMPGGAAEADFDVPPATSPNGTGLAFDVAPLARVRPLRRALALRYGLAGLGFACVATAIMFVLNDIAFQPLRFGVVVVGFAFPAFVMALYVSGLRWPVMLAGALAWLAVLYVVTPLSATLLAILVGPSLLLALVAGNPALRTTAIPLFLVAVALVVPLVFSLEASLALLELGVFDVLNGRVPAAVVLALYIVLGLVIALAAGTVAALVAVRLVARLTARTSEFMMQNDLLWLFQALWLVGLGWGNNGPPTLSYLAAFAAYRAVLWLLRPGGEATEINLLLRVFGQQATQKDLARGLLLDWRQRGPVLLIGAEDLATETLDAPELAAFMSGRLDRIFIETPDDLERARHAGDARLGDGLFAMQDYYCRDTSWRPTVLTLMSRAQRVLVDMRGFDETRQGIRFEIDALAARVPAERIIVVTDAARIDEVSNLFSRAFAELGRGGATRTLAIRHT